MDDDLIWFQTFFASFCDGNWEHIHGFKVASLDNPGWHLTCDLQDTPFEEISFTPIVDLRTEDNWINISKRGSTFWAVGGPHNLGELISELRSWVEGSGIYEKWLADDL